MELNPNEEPVWTYFDAQHKSIVDQMKEAYAAGRSSVEGKIPSSDIGRKDSLGTSYPREEFTEHFIP